MENAGDRVGIAKQLIEDGKAQEAIVCLQAEV
jgi:peroxin-5